MFADVKGYSTVVEKLDPEWVGALVDRLWGELGRIVVDHDGRVLQHLGDGVMALWGGEHSFEDDAEKAVRAGSRCSRPCPASSPIASARARCSFGSGSTQGSSTSATSG